jgi:hypothetical protein
VNGREEFLVKNSFLDLCIGILVKALLRNFAFALCSLSLSVSAPSAFAELPEILPSSSLTSAGVQQRDFTVLNSDGNSKQLHSYTVSYVSSKEGIGGSFVSIGDAEVGIIARDGQAAFGQRVGDELVVEKFQAEHEDGDHAACASPLLGPDASQTYQNFRESRLIARPEELTSSVREIELLAVAPGDFVAGRSEQEAIDEIVFAVEGANVLYRPLGIRIKLSAIQVFSPGVSDPYGFAAQSQNAYTMLDQLRAQWLFRSDIPRDISIVFAASSFQNVYGLAFPAASCVAPEFSYGFVSKGGARWATGKCRFSFDANPRDWPSLGHEPRWHLNRCRSDGDVAVFYSDSSWIFRRFFD